MVSSNHLPTHSMPRGFRALYTSASAPVLTLISFLNPPRPSFLPPSFPPVVRGSRQLNDTNWIPSQKKRPSPQSALTRSVPCRQHNTGSVTLASTNAQGIIASSAIKVRSLSQLNSHRAGSAGVKSSVLRMSTAGMTARALRA